MSETAAHLVDHVFPVQPVRQWVLSVPKRLRYFLQRDRVALNAALQLFLRVIKSELIGQFKQVSLLCNFVVTCPWWTEFLSRLIKASSFVKPSRLVLNRSTIFNKRFAAVYCEPLLGAVI
jgi:hypothetical protein